MTDNTQELDEILEDFYDGDIRQSDMGKAKQAITDWHNKQIKDPFDYVQPCEPDCSPERHAYHQGQWDMAHRMVGKEAEL